MTNELAHGAIDEIAAIVFPGTAVVRSQPVRGGLEGAVARLRLRNAAREHEVIVKRLGIDGLREADRYHLLASSGATPVLLGSVRRGDSTYLFLEKIRAVGAWPWRDAANTTLVLEQLARVHAFGKAVAQPADWDYEAELQRSAAETVEVATSMVSSLPELDLRSELSRLRRVAAALDSARPVMAEALGETLIHGDVHSGNVMLRRRGGRTEAVLLDWGRSRIGSPLEDVSSWLLSLRNWEPAAARSHDTLLRAYLAAAGRPTALTPELRHAYWIAASRNVFAGALRYQLFVAGQSTGTKRSTAIAHAQAALRVIRRADERLPRG